MNKLHDFRLADTLIKFLWVFTPKGIQYLKKQILLQLAWLNH